MLVAAKILMAKADAGLGFSLFVASIFIFGGIEQLFRARRLARDYTLEQRKEMFPTAWRSDSLARHPARSAVFWLHRHRAWHVHRRPIHRARYLSAPNPKMNRGHVGAGLRSPSQSNERSTACAEACDLPLTGDLAVFSGWLSGAR
jgi:hypothetical protein